MDDVLILGAADSGSDEIQCTFYGGTICLTVEEPWAGDTESGLGRACSINLTAETAALLAEWLADKARKLADATPNNTLQNLQEE